MAVLETSTSIKLASHYGELFEDGNGTFTWQIPTFSEVRRNACNNVQDRISSSIFYSQVSGYKMRLTLYPDGIGDSKGKSLGLFLELLAGSYDDLLVWPFSANVSLCNVM